jgi:hypothetical protein
MPVPTPRLGIHVSTKQKYSSVPFEFQSSSLLPRIRFSMQQFRYRSSQHWMLTVQFSCMHPSCYTLLPVHGYKFTLILLLKPPLQECGTFSEHMHPKFNEGGTRILLQASYYNQQQSAIVVRTFHRSTNNVEHTNDIYLRFSLSISLQITNGQLHPMRRIPPDNNREEHQQPWPYTVLPRRLRYCSD